MTKGDIMKKFISILLAMILLCSTFMTTTAFATDNAEINDENVAIDSSVDFQTISVVGNGNGNWLNGCEWSTTDNQMTEIEDNLYQITFKNVKPSDGYCFKFVADGSWDNNWGGEYKGINTETDATYNEKENYIEFDISTVRDVIITFDLRNFDPVTKTGAKFTIGLEYNTKIYFEAPELYGTPKTVFCYIYSVYGDDDFVSLAYRSKATKCDLVDETRMIYSYDTFKLNSPIEPYADYGVIFTVMYPEGEFFETKALTFGSDCFDDEVYVDVNLDGDATGYTCKWKHNSEKYGEAASITGKGEVTGEYFPVNQPREEIIAEWLGRYAVYNEKYITTDVVENLCATVGAKEADVYFAYQEMFADELADIENNPMIAPMERIIVLLGFHDPVYVVAGTANLCGVDWTADPTVVPYNVMSWSGDVYKKTYKDVQPTDYASFKVIRYTYDDEMPWYGCSDDETFIFEVTDVCDITITYDPSTKKVEIIGDYVVMYSADDFDTISVVGNGKGNWLDGILWDTFGNLMTEIEEDLYQITFKDVPAGEDYQFKFAADGSWEDNWGGVFTDFGIETDALHNHYDNISFDLTHVSDVTITFDLRNYEGVNKTGAKFNVSITQKGLADANGDGAIDVNDATLIQKYAVGLVDETQIYLDYADINGDGNVNVEDATLIQKYLAGRYQLIF